MRAFTRLIVLVLLLSLLGCAAHRPANRLYQTSTITSLLEGVYDGDLTLAELARQGDFGLGTFDDLDGEMILLDGVFYQIRSDGKAYRPTPQIRTPLAVVTYFRPTQTIALDYKLSYEALMAQLDELRGSENVPCAFRLDGEFDFVRTRSVPRQSPPYQRLAEVTRRQPTFDFENVRGTLVVFWVPQYMRQLNVPGYHMHFITSDRSAGGHVLDCRPGRVKVQAAELPELYLRLPGTSSFRNAKLSEDRGGELKAAEQQAPTTH